MPPEIINILQQAPIVLVFIWFVLEWSKRNQGEMDRRDESMRKFLYEQRDNDRTVLRDLVSEIKAISEHLSEHDVHALEVLHILKSEKTRPRKPLPPSAEK